MCGSLPQLASSCHTSRHCAPHSGPSTASLKTPEQRVGRGVPSQRAHTYVSTSRRAFSKCQAGHHPAQEAPRDQLSGEYPSQMFPDLRPFSGGGSGSRAQLQSKQVRASCWNPSQLGDQGPWCKVDSQRSGVRGGQASLPRGPSNTTHGPAPPGDTCALYSHSPARRGNLTTSLKHLP